MKLRTKFNLVIITVFVAGAAALAWLSHSLLIRNAEVQIQREAGQLMESALAVRAYTNQQVRPLLLPQMDQVFHAPAVAAFSAIETFRRLHEKLPYYSYNEPTLNPTNPRDKADTWQSEVIGRFRADPNLKEISGTRVISGKEVLYIARPITIKDPACLTCHSTPAAAPASMLKVYGDQGGFGWQLNETVGMQLVTVPTEVPKQLAYAALKTFLGGLGAVMLVLFIVLNLMLSRLVIRPVLSMANAADRISRGEMDGEPFSRPGKDEISLLAQSFDRMHNSLEIAMKSMRQRS